jgi:endonuclease YncB( thermonuclease family)
MPFTLIAGTFHVVGRTKSGSPSGFEPDGDSMQFRPTTPALLSHLKRLDQPVRLTTIGSTQLRFEGIDALELHFSAGKGGVVHQPRPLADDARDFLTKELRLDPVRYQPPSDLRVLPPVRRDGAKGFILSRALDVHGRPVSFVFNGKLPAKDGTEVELDAALLRRSSNYLTLRAGNAYPLFYDTLFADLRNVLARAAVDARAAKRGLWAQDGSTRGVGAADPSALEKDGVTFPKLFRRLIEFYGQGGASLAGFLPWLEASEEQVLDLTKDNVTHFDNVVGVRGSKVRMLRKPGELVFISAKTKNKHAAPWVSPTTVTERLAAPLQ